MHFQPPGPENRAIILQMPFQKSLGESTEVVFLYGNVGQIDLPIANIETIKYDKGILSINEYLTGVVSPCKELRLCLLDENQSVSEHDNEVEIPMLFKRGTTN